jgi:site-specific DNA recombinase
MSNRIAPPTVLQTPGGSTPDKEAQLMKSVSQTTKRAVLYARVSTKEQAEHGYSLAQQIEALRAYCRSEGIEIVAEFSDPGQSGASLRRPGLTALSERVTEGGVDLILVQDRDRFAREPAYLYLLDREFGEHGCKLKALNDRGDDTPEGQLTDAIIAQIAKYERAKFAERAQRGRLQRAREGKVIGSGSPPFGFRYNAGRTNYVVEPADMVVVRRMVEMVADGYTLHSIKKIFEREGIRPPGGGEYWHVPSMRRTVLNDVYLARTHEEIRTLVSPQVAATLDPEASYGV